jgi:putative NADPH-quinone reductase
MRIYLVLGHPDSDSFNGALADAYQAAAEAKGHEVRRHNLGELKFDPILWHGYEVIQDLEPDLKAAQENIAWCERIVLFYPVWWGSVPALLKGFFDRAILPGQAFSYHENDPFWDKLLKGRDAQLFTTSDGPTIYLLLAYRNSDVATVKNAVLQFCGIRPVKVTRFGGIKTSSAAQREKYLEQVRRAV